MPNVSTFYVGRSLGALFHSIVSLPNRVKPRCALIDRDAIVRGVVERTARLCLDAAIHDGHLGGMSRNWTK